MVALSTHPLLANPYANPFLFFARETEPDLDFDEDLDELEDETSSRSYSPKGPRKKSSRGPLMWLLILLIVAGGGYLAMNPDLLMDTLGPMMGEAPPAPVVVKPPPTPQVTPPVAPQATPTPPAPGALPSPRFSEGQPVSVVIDPAAPGAAIALKADAAGTRPGPTVKPGATLTVLDGSFENNVWVYSVRTQGGAVGWIPENKLIAKP